MLLASLVFAVCGLISPVVYGQQAILDKTTFGHSQNDSRDFENSLIPGKKRYDKGEKKEEVDLKTLQSKSVKDPTFQGNLMDLDLDWRGNKLGKPGSNVDKDSKGPKKADGTGEKDPKVAQQADTTSDKDPKAKSAAPAEKTSEKEKASASKPDGEH